MGPKKVAKKNKTTIRVLPPSIVSDPIDFPEDVWDSESVERVIGQTFDIPKVIRHVLKTFKYVLYLPAVTSKLQGAVLRACPKDLMLIPTNRGSVACSSWTFAKGWIVVKDGEKRIKRPIGQGFMFESAKGLTYAVLLVNQRSLSDSDHE